MRRRALSLGLLLAVVCWHAPLHADTPVQEILKTADESRGNREGIVWEVMLESTGSGGDKTLTFAISARGFDMLGEYLAPPKYKGNKVLMVQQNMWFYKPGLSKPVPISRRQKLSGHAAYGDIAATNYADDYTATLLPEESLAGEACYVFDLQARDKSKTTYDRIKYWVSKSRLVGLQAHYFTVSGKMFKSATMVYNHQLDVGNVPRPFISQMTFHDELLSAEVTTLTFNTPRLQALPDYIFNLNLLIQ